MKIIFTLIILCSATLFSTAQKTKLPGTWYMAGDVSQTLILKKDSSFTMVDYNSTLKKNEDLKGRYAFKKNIVVLIYSDGHTKKFKYVYDKDFKEFSIVGYEDKSNPDAGVPYYYKKEHTGNNID